MTNHRQTKARDLPSLSTLTPTHPKQRMLWAELYHLLRGEGVDREKATSLVVRRYVVSVYQGGKR